VVVSEGAAVRLASRMGDIDMKAIRAKLAALLALVVVSVATAPLALAAVPEEVEDVFTTAATDFGTVVGYGWILFLAIVGGLILFKIVRKVFAKST
jgi:hypothetical protein